jgi:hypothetical protein
MYSDCVAPTPLPGLAYVAPEVGEMRTEVKVLIPVWPKQVTANSIMSNNKMMAEISPRGKELGPGSLSFNLSQELVFVRDLIRGSRIFIVVVFRGIE